MKIAIVEDEEIFAEKLREKAEEYFSGKGRETEISRYSDGTPLLCDIEKGERFVLIFLDLQLESSDGMDIAARLRKYDRNAAVIFVTGIPDRATEGYGVEAFDYIVKSRLEDRLENVLGRFMERLEKSSLSVLLTDGSRAVIPLCELYAIASEGRATVLYTAAGKSVTSLAVGKISPELPPEDYFEVHKGVYIRIEQIRSIGSDTLVISDNRIFPVSRRRRKPLLAAVMERAKGM